MREIKFRARSKNVGMWGEVTDIQFRDGEIVHIRGLASYNGKSQQPIGGHADHMDITEINLMQYTGFHDKNGAEQYHRDIVLRRGVVDRLGTEPYDLVGEIIWREGDCGFGVRFSTIEQVVALSPFDEVIGNIWENPELMEEQNE